MPFDSGRALRAVKERRRARRGGKPGLPCDPAGISSRGLANPKARTRVLVVDDHPLVRQGLRDSIAREPDLFICAEAEDCQGALAAAASSKPDLVIVDLGLRDSSGLELIKELRQRYPNLRTLVFSMYDEALYAEEAVRAGACGYVSKQALTAKLVEAIRLVLKGEIYRSERAAALVASKLTRSALGGSQEPADCLSKRELQVFELLGIGSATSEIAADLHVQASTVESYRARIKRKLRLKDASELLQLAIRWNLGRIGSQRMFGGTHRIADIGTG